MSYDGYTGMALLMVSDKDSIRSLGLLVIQRSSFLKVLYTFDPYDLESVSRSFISTMLVELHHCMLQAQYQFSEYSG